MPKYLRVFPFLVYLMAYLNCIGYTALNGGRFGKMLAGNGRGLFKGISLHFPGVSMENHEHLRIV
jgi:hypothetical protein